MDNRVPKRILVISQFKKDEGLRMANGLTLLDDKVRVIVVGNLEKNENVDIQLEAIEFGETPLQYIDPDKDSDLNILTDEIQNADVVYIL
ncbi:MAG: hypothetical protein M1458_01785 [Deltaproteobacteria bacterium]|nr:hypothetical protein [Deltaproteobacteria bacterium]